jgi:EpsI family protein
VRKVNYAQIIALILCLGFTGYLIYLRPTTQIQNRKAALVQTLSHIDNWQKVSVSPLDPIIVEELKLDEYVFQNYAQGEDKIDLYVGYYYSSTKVGAAHDPLVCFPGQGWHVSDHHKSSLNVTGEKGYKINFSTLLAGKNDEKELVFYWYQAGSQATSGPLMQKLMLLRSKFLRRGENNAFVRVSTTLKNESAQQGQKRILNFIKDFYPPFLKYVEGS